MMVPMNIKEIFIRYNHSDYLLPFLCHPTISLCQFIGNPQFATGTQTSNNFFRNYHSMFRIEPGL